MAEKINIRGVLIDNVNLAEATEICAEFIRGDQVRAVFTPNSEIIQSCVEDAAMTELINSADLVIPDGIGVIYASRILKHPLKAKTAGYELGLEIVKLSSETGCKLYFLGGGKGKDGAPDIAELAKEKLLEKYPSAQIVGTHHGYFKKEGEESDAVIAEINALQPDVLYVCLGVPVQEKWIAANRDKFTTVKLCLALGGSLDGYSGNVKRAPKIFIKLGLEWFYRLIKEPRRIGRMMKLPKFLFGTIFYRIRFHRMRGGK